MKAERLSTTPKLKLFEVLYAVEQGFIIVVKARSADEAERRVQKCLDDTRSVLKGSERGHFEALTIQAEEVSK